MKRKKATDAEKLTYLAIFQADCALSMVNLSSARKILGEAMTKMNVEHTHIAQAAFGLNAEKLLRKHGGVARRNS